MFAVHPVFYKNLKSKFAERFSFFFNASLPLFLLLSSFQDLILHLVIYLSDLLLLPEVFLLLFSFQDLILHLVIYLLDLFLLPWVFLLLFSFKIWYCILWSTFWSTSSLGVSSAVLFSKSDTASCDLPFWWCHIHFGHLC